MNERKLNLVVTDYDLRGKVQKYRLDPVHTPELLDYVSQNLTSGAAICYLFLPKGLEHSQRRRLLEERASKFSERPDQHFRYSYNNPQGGPMIEGMVVNWPPHSDTLKNYKVFNQFLEGTHKSQERSLEPRRVDLVVDCTDHPLIETVLEGMGYDVKKTNIFEKDWPERKDDY